MRVAGIMSGTSLDGIDVAIADVTRRRLELVAFETYAYPEPLRRRILAVSDAVAPTREISRLNFELGERYAAAVRRLCGAQKVPLETLELSGCHGQTIYHEKGNTLQIGEAAVIAERLRIPVVSDFRTRDVAAGGQGAPLVPFVDYRLFRHRTRGRVALNIGGIANVTIIPANAAPEQVIAFDTGPGNMVIDALVAEATGGKKRFDRGGALAGRARPDRPLLDGLLKDSYYKAAPPKTTGRERYGKDFVRELLATGLALDTLIATATALTAATIALGIRRNSKDHLEELIAAGGGVYNRTLISQLQALLPELNYSTTADHGIPADAKEALAFAVLAWETWHGNASNLPSATGAGRSVILGKITR